MNMGKYNYKFRIKNFFRDEWWKIYGRQFVNPFLQKVPETIVFICKGNICRSPFAEHIAKNEFKLFNSLVIFSAGLHVKNSEKSSNYAIITAKSYGVDLSNHCSISFDASKLYVNSMIIAMEAQQIKELKALYPYLKSSLYLLPLFDPLRHTFAFGYDFWNIPDPYGKSCIEYNECYARINRCVKNMVHIFNK